VYNDVLEIIGMIARNYGGDFLFRFALLPLVKSSSITMFTEREVVRKKAASDDTSTEVQRLELDFD